MSKDKNIWEKFYPQDWQGDEGLQMCSLAARGLWVEMLCIMWSNGGYLKIGSMQIEESHLARKVGSEVDQVRTLIHELENFGVFSRTRSGVIYSRRIVKSEKKSQINRKNGEKGGRPKSQKNKDNSSLGFENENESESETKAPEARSQIPDKKKKIKKEKKDYWFDGEVIKLNRADYETWFERYPGTDDQFMDWLTGMDNWLKPKPPESRAKWFIITSSALSKLEAV